MSMVRKAERRSVLFVPLTSPCRPIAAQCDDGSKGSADMMAMDASRQLWTARVDHGDALNVGRDAEVLVEWPASEGAVKQRQ